MSKKITQEEFLKRFSNNYPDADITLIDYTAISNKLTAKCNKCGKEFHYSRAREILSNFSCCGRGNETKIKKLIRLYDGSEDFDFVKQVDKDHYIVHHKTCGNDLKRVIQNSLDNPFACTYCNSIKK